MIGTSYFKHLKSGIYLSISYYFLLLQNHIYIITLALNLQKVSFYKYRVPLLQLYY